jgi:hypothetical protein
MGIETAIIAAMAASTATSLYNTVESKKTAKKSAEQARQQGEQQARMVEQETQKAARDADMATNRANPKRPNAGALLAANQQSALAGQSGTMLTGPAGVDPLALQLGKNTLLGQ